MNGLATYTFLPWVRRGISTEITRVDGADDAAVRAQVPITLELDATGQRRASTVTLDLYGPGEVAGIDPRMIIRTEPTPDSEDAEPNYFPAVDFYEPDFPWRYTPARATAEHRIRPWLVLIVLAATEIKEEHPAGADGTLGSVLVETAQVLPDLGQSWAWAHGQISALEEGESVQEIIDHQPHRAISRLLCPRKLRSRTRYTAFLVPSFLRGRLAGLNQPIPDTGATVVDGLTAAWTHEDNNVLLPIYYKWQFSTGTQGDFEFLVRKLRARQITGDVGKRPIDVGAPDPGLPPAAEAPLEMEGALKALTTTPAPWPDAQRRRFLNGHAPKIGLTELVNRPQDLLDGGHFDPIVVPPLYGRWHARQTRLRPDHAPSWFNVLNQDPRHRASASLGTRVVQQQQEQLMASAWEQLEGVLAVNQTLCHTQFGRELADQVRTKYLMDLPHELVVNITAPVHRRIRASRQTVFAICNRARIGYFGEGSFRRVTRTRGPISRRLKHISRDLPDTMLTRANNHDITPSPAPVTQDNMITNRKLGQAVLPPSITVRDAHRQGLWAWLSLVLALLLLLFVVLGGIGLMAGVGVGAVALGLVVVGITQRRRANRLRAALGLRDGTLTADDVRAVRPDRDFVPTQSAAGSHIPPPPKANVHDPLAAAAFQTAFAELAAQAFDVVPTEPAPVPVDMPVMRDKLIAGMNPRINHVAAIQDRLTIAQWVDWQPRDPLDKVMAGPEFEQPMYEPLRDLSQEWLMPGVGQIPQNTTALLVTNQRFIEAYMAGLNHEMARELLWREYPTDLRGTYFRQFWDVRSFVHTGVGQRSRETLRDIKNVHEWDDGLLGHNSPRTPPSGGEHLVLLLRGEVLKRYPNTSIYAVRATRGADGKLALGTTESHPVFGGALDPDLSFFGFELTAAQVRGGQGQRGDPGWFFVLQQQPTEPRFGLDVPDAATAGGAVGASWDDLSWGHLVADMEAMDGLNYIDLTADRPDTRFTDTSEANWHAGAGSDAAQLAYITLQKPFRVAIHGKAMVPEEA